MKHICFIILALFSFSLVNAIQVSGTQSGTWTPANNPYEVIGTINVPSGDSLWIMPGVIVHITGSFQITVAGALNCVGTVADSIRFLNTQPTALWPGLRFENPTTQSQVSYTYIERATYGIRCMNSPLSVSYSRINLCEKGMELYAIGATTPSNVIVQYNIIENCTQNGILVTQNSAATIHHNEIRYNGTGSQFRAAIQLANQSATGSCSPTISYNHIHHNRKQGISAWDVSSSGAIAPLISNNIIEYNYTGLYLLQASGYVADNQINYNFIPGDMNSGAGVMVSGATSMPYFERNHIEGNYTGFYITNNAQPILGNMDIDHVWAQGENVIINNIDANSVLHSVFCDAYANAGNTIKAENNNWGVSTAAEIAIGINDHTDNAALPTVDFEPFLSPILPTTILGSYVYNGPATIESSRLELISVGTGVLLFTFPLSSTTINLTAPLTEQFYAQIVLTSGTRELFGCAGGYLNPIIFNLTDVAPVEIGTIEVTDTPPPSYDIIGGPIVENTQTLYPIMHGFALYGWSSMDWVTAQGDYLLLIRNIRRTPTGDQVTELAPGAIYTKVANISPYDGWTETRINSDGAPEQIAVTHTPCSVDLGMVAYHLTTRKLGTTTLSKTMHSDDEQTVFRYAPGGSLMAIESVLPLGEPTPLGLPGVSLYTPLELSPNPTFLSFDPNYYDPFQVRLMWQAPAGGSWTHYNIYRNGQLISQISFSQSEFLDTEWNNNYGTTSYIVCAWDGENLSEPTNWVMVIITDNEDELIQPVSLSYYPNPVFASKGQNLEIKLNNLKNQSTEIEIYNLKGQKVHQASLIARDNYQWNCLDDSGRRCASGIYMLKVRVSGERTLTRKLILY